LRQPNRCQAAATGVGAPGPARTKPVLCAVNSSKSEDKGAAPEYKINVRICAGQKVELQVLQTRPQEMRTATSGSLSFLRRHANCMFGKEQHDAADIQCCYEEQCILGRDAVQSAGILLAYRGKNLPTLKIEAAHYAIMSVNFYQAARCSHS